MEKHFFKSFLWGIKSLGAKNIGGLRIIQEKVVYISPLIFSHILKAVQWLSVSNSLRPMDCSTAGFPVHHQLPEFTQTHLHWVGDAIWPSHRPLLLPSIFPSIRVFSSESVLPIRWPKYWSFNFNISPSNEYSGLISFRIDWLDLLAVQCSHEIKRCLPLGRKVMTNLDSILKSRHYFANKGPSSQGYGFSSSHVWMWELDYKES